MQKFIIVMFGSHRFAVPIIEALHIVSIEQLKKINITDGLAGHVQVGQNTFPVLDKRSKISDSLSKGTVVLVISSQVKTVRHFEDILVPLPVGIIADKIIGTIDVDSSGLVSEEKNKSENITGFIKKDNSIIPIINLGSFLDDREKELALSFSEKQKKLKEKALTKAKEDIRSGFSKIFSAHRIEEIWKRTHQD